MYSYFHENSIKTDDENIITQINQIFNSFQQNNFIMLKLFYFRRRVYEFFLEKIWRFLL